MVDGSFGLTEAVSMSPGGMIGSGIYAVLGVVAGITHAATRFAFLLAGVIASSPAYSCVRVNELATDEGDGDVGSVAGDAFAFAEFTISLPTLATRSDSQLEFGRGTTTSEPNYTYSLRFPYIWYESHPMDVSVIETAIGIRENESERPMQDSRW